MSMEATMSMEANMSMKASCYGSGGQRAGRVGTVRQSLWHSKSRGMICPPARLPAPPPCPPVRLRPPPVRLLPPPVRLLPPPVRLPVCPPATPAASPPAFPPVSLPACVIQTTPPAGSCSSMTLCAKAGTYGAENRLVNPRLGFSAFVIQNKVVGQPHSKALPRVTT